MLNLLNERSKKLFIEAKKVIPGGVNSPVRAFKSVGGDPIFIKKAKGAYLFDEDDTDVHVWVAFGIRDETRQRRKTDR